MFVRVTPGETSFLLPHIAIPFSFSPLLPKESRIYRWQLFSSDFCPWMSPPTSAHPSHHAHKQLSQLQQNKADNCHVLLVQPSRRLELNEKNQSLPFAASWLSNFSFVDADLSSLLVPLKVQLLDWAAERWKKQITRIKVELKTDLQPD